MVLWSKLLWNKVYLSLCWQDHMFFIPDNACQKQPTCPSWIESSNPLESWDLVTRLLADLSLAQVFSPRSFTCPSFTGLTSLLLSITYSMRSPSASSRNADETRKVVLKYNGMLDMVKLTKLSKYSSKKYKHWSIFWTKFKIWQNGLWPKLSFITSHQIYH